MHVETGFPRSRNEIGDQSWFWHPLKNYEEYRSYILSTLPTKATALVEFYSDTEKLSKTVNRILIDTDYEDPGFNKEKLIREWDYIRPFCRFFWDYIRIFFSGRHGFHIYFYAHPFTITYDLRTKFKRWMSAWVGDETLLDTRPLLSLRRMCRIPMSYHQKTGYLIVPVHYNMTVDQILEQAQNPSDTYLQQFIGTKKQWSISQMPCICEFI